MGLCFTPRIGDVRLGEVFLRRTRPLDLRDPEAIKDEISVYEVHHDGDLIGTLEHRYGNGAWRLISAATLLIAEKRH